MRTRISAKDFVADALILTLSAFTVKLIGVIFKVPLSYILTDEGMGYFNSAYTVFGCFYVICAAGVPKAVSILISEARALGDEDLSNMILKHTRSAFLAIGTFFGFVLFILAKPLSAFVGNSGAAPSIITVSFSLAFISVSGVMRGYLSGVGRHIPIAICELIEAVFKLFFGLVLAKYSVYCGFSLELTAAFAVSGISFGAAVSSIFLYICIGKKRGNKRRALSLDKGGILRRVFKISVPIALSSFLLTVTNLIDLTFVMRRLGDIGYTEESAAALYGNYTTLAVPFLGLCISLISPISVAAVPRLSSAYARADMSEFKYGLSRAIQLSSFIGALFTFGCMYFSFDALSLIFSDESAKTAAPYLSMLAPSFLLSGVLICTNTALEATGRTTAPLISMLFGALVKTAASYILVADARIGVGGAAIGTVLFYAAALTVSLIFLFSHVGNGVSFFLPMTAAILNAQASALCAKFIQELTKDRVETPLNTLLTGGIYAILYLILSRITAFRHKKSDNCGEFVQNSNILLLK